MTDTPDHELLEQFARNASEAAFAVLVERYLALVHSVALRHTSQPQQAQDIAQTVFIILARKAGTLGRKCILSGWLYHTARLTALNFQRMEARRVRREQEAFMQSPRETNGNDEVWRELSPHLEAAIARLGAADRDALVLRYFQNKSLAEVGLALGLEERAAQKRVVRAVEKLRKFFGRRGLALSAAALTTTLSAHSVQAAPAALAQTVTALALTQGAAASTSTLTLGALKLMAWSKAKTAIITGVCVLLTAGVTVGTVAAVRALRPPPDIQGAWAGVVQIRTGSSLRVVLKVGKTGGGYRATADSIDQRVKDIPVNVLDYHYPKIHFEMAAVKGTFDGSFNPASSEMSGTWKQPVFDLDVPLKLARTASPPTIPDLLADSDCVPRAGSDLQGYWRGAIDIGTGTLRVAFEISDPGDGTYPAEMDSLDQGANHLVVSAIRYDQPAVRIEVGSVGGVFAGDLSGDEIKGTWTQLGKSMPLTLRRTDPRVIHAEAAASAAQKNYAYSSPDDLTGHWRGVLNVNGMKLHLALHVAKLPGGEFAGALDSLDQGVNGLAANVVRFTAPAARLEWQTINGVYVGTVARDRLTGQWSQNGQTFPLEFKRSPE